MSSKAAATRLNILQQAFGLVYRNGYRTTSVDEIIAATNVTKGAFFYHFKNKEEMGLAMIHEVMYPGMRNAMVEPLLTTKDPIQDIYAMMKGLLMENPFFEVKYGCPAINLVEEMASQSPVFHSALSKLTDEWRDAIVTSLEKGKENGTVKIVTDSSAAALYIMSGYGGIRNLGKVYGVESYKGFLEQFKVYLGTL